MIQVNINYINDYIKSNLDDRMINKDKQRE